jgi:NADH-quinone oxidoreductase subunit A
MGVVFTYLQYLPIFLLLLLGLVFAVGSFIGSSTLGPRKKPSQAKLSPYECGIVPDHEPAQRFPVRFYLIAMIFIIFDIEIVFLYPFAVDFHQMKVFSLVEVILFALVVFIAFLYLVSNGALNWGPAKQLNEGMPARTSESTISRITGDRSKEEAA